MTTVTINPSMLIWARERAALGLAVLATKLDVAVDKLVAWETGVLQPSFAQAKSVADKTHVPFGYLFLRQPPEDAFPIPDLRTVNSERPASISLELKETVMQVVARQRWLTEYHSK